MIKFELPSSQELHIERDTLEARAQELIGSKLTEAKTLNPLLRSALKGTADLLLSTLGIKAPKGVDKLEYLAAYVLHLGLDAIDDKVIPVEGKLVAADVANSN